MSNKTLESEAQREITRFMDDLVRRNPGMPEFHQAVHEVVESLMPYVIEHTQYREARILERLVEPDRVVIFRVVWEDDHGGVHVNRAWRVQFSNALGPYKGGLRFHPSVNQSILKFLGFEQIFKNSLTGLPMGGAKGGSNFNPKDKSEREVMRFCQSMMVELHRHIGEDVDVPAGDIGVGAREIGYMYGYYKKIRNEHTGVLTGKGLEYGGSLIRPEATGYGCGYFIQNMLETRGEGVAGKTCVISGSGNVALYAAEKLHALGGKVVSMSDSDGSIHDKDGIGPDKLAWLKHLKEIRRGRIRDYAEHFGCEYYEGKRPWHIPCENAVPCATQNELDENDAHLLIGNGVKAVAEGANMAEHPRRDAPAPRRRRALWTGQGGQRRRGRGVGARADAERHAHVRGIERRWIPSSRASCAISTQNAWSRAATVNISLRERRQPGWIHQGRRRHAGVWPHLDTMKLHADLSRRAVVHSDDVAWVDSPIPGVQRKMLERDGGEVARATSLVRYAPGSRFSPHVHGGGEEFLVLGGVFSDEHGDFGPGAYVRNPVGSAHAPGSTPGCTILVKLRQMDPADQSHVRIDTRTRSWTPSDEPGMSIMLLHVWGSERVGLQRWAPGARLAHHAHEGGARSSCSRAASPMSTAAIRRAPGFAAPTAASIRPFTEDGCLLYMKLGHLPVW
jgi:glutamate dehydrogenase (NADP+)